MIPSAGWPSIPIPPTAQPSAAEAARGGEVVVNTRPPPGSDTWSVPPNFFGGTFENISRREPITSAPGWLYNPTVSVSRRVYPLSEFEGIHGAICLGSIGFLYSGYSHTRDINPYNAHINIAEHAGPFRNALLPITMSNCLLLSLAEKYQTRPVRRLTNTGVVEETYDEKFIQNLFRPDGVISVVTGDNAGGSHGGYSGWRSDPYTVITKCGRVVVRNIWGPGLQEGTPLYIKLQKYSPASLEGLPYNVNPADGINSAYDGIIKRLKGGMPDPVSGGKRPEQWVYQFSPVQPYQLGYGNFKPEDIDRTLYYTDEAGKLRKAKVYKIGIVTRHIGGTVLPIETVKSRYGSTVGIPNTCVNTSELIACNMVEILASAV